MKLYQILLFLPLLLITLDSCKKYDFDQDLPTIEGTSWVLVSGKVYTENLTTGEKLYYDHFDNTQTTSNLDIFGGSIADMDILEQNVTTWYFYENVFTINGNNTYEYSTQGSGTRKQYTIFGIPPHGSSRNIEVIEFNENIMNVKLYESNESHNGDNYHYFSTLTFVRVGYTCSQCGTPPNVDYTYMGTIVNVVEPLPGHLQLGGTSWVITRYDNGMTPTYPNDTLNFISGVTYDINGGNINTYSFSNNTGNNLYNLTLYECPTLGGNYSGQVGLSFIDVGELNNLTMNGIFGTSGSINVWLERIN